MFQDFTDNKYERIWTPDQYAATIKSQRMDDLDRACLDYIHYLKSKHNHINVIECGGRYGVHTKRMSIAGASVTMIDKIELPDDYFSAYGHDGHIFPIIKHLRKNFLDIVNDDIPSPLHIIYSQRALNYISYNDAYKLLTRFYNALESDGALFLSMAGAETEYGLTHEARHLPIDERFAKISPDMQDRHEIYDNICVYSQSELRDMVQKIGFCDVLLGQSGFGNVKMIGFKSPKPPLELFLQS
jgi:hypothetical protein